jgi:DNA repair protein RecN (Recombination protein N)
MLEELVIDNLGVVSHAELSFSEGLTVITGETGAGKTLLVTALDLLSGARAGAHVVREGAKEAAVAGRFLEGDQEHIVRRTVSESGRTKSYRDGSPITLTELSEFTQNSVEIHGQNSQHGLLKPNRQRAALDSFANIDTSQLVSLRAEVREYERELTRLGGDPHERERELDMLRFQARELEAAKLYDPKEDENLSQQESMLANSTEIRSKGEAAYSALENEGAYDAVSNAISALREAPQFADAEKRLTELRDQITETAREIRGVTESITDDPAQLAQVQERRAVLTQLRRKYGDDLEAVMRYATEVNARIAELESVDERTAELRNTLETTKQKLNDESQSIRKQRVAAGNAFAKSIVDVVKTLAIPHAQVAVEFDDSPAADGVTILFSANPGNAPGALSSIASGGELSRVMLAIRLISMNVYSKASTYVFDEVDAGIGGEAAIAVGRSLASLAQHDQVLLVTHLPQVAAFGDHHITVEKIASGKETRTEIANATGSSRVVELSRMLSGQPKSTRANEHAEELLDLAEHERSLVRSKIS